MGIGHARVNLDELTAGTAGTGYIDCPVLNNTFNLSLLVRGSKISSAFHLNKSKEELRPTLGMETDAQNDATELAFSDCNSPVVSATNAVRHTSTADFFLDMPFVQLLRCLSTKAVISSLVKTYQ